MGKITKYQGSISDLKIVRFFSLDDNLKSFIVQQNYLGVPLSKRYFI